MAPGDGQIEFQQGATSIQVSVPSFSYKTTISLPFDWQKMDDGTWEGFDNGTAYDKRKCECTLFFTAAQMATFNDFHRTDGEGRAIDITMRMNANSGFHPFGPDKGDVGDFTVAVEIKNHGMVGESPFRYFKVDLVIYNTGSWPAYTPPAEVDDGDFTIGTITDLRFPPGWFEPEAEYGTFMTLEENSTSQWIDRSVNFD